jgi:hypothetical protein
LFQLCHSKNQNNLTFNPRDFWNCDFICFFFGPKFYLSRKLPKTVKWGPLYAMYSAATSWVLRREVIFIVFSNISLFSTQIVIYLLNLWILNHCFRNANKTWPFICQCDFYLSYFIGIVPNFWIIFISAALVKNRFQWTKPICVDQSDKTNQENSGNEEPTHDYQIVVLCQPLNPIFFRQVSCDKYFEIKIIYMSNK